MIPFFIEESAKYAVQKWGGKINEITIVLAIFLSITILVMGHLGIIK